MKLWVSKRPKYILGLICTTPIKEKKTREHQIEGNEI